MHDTMTRLDVDEFLNIFGGLISSLITRWASPTPKKSIFKKNTHFTEYSFTTMEAIQRLQETQNMDKQTAGSFIDAFLDAHLLHAPTNRALRASPSANTELQPTAKGFYFLDKWVESEKEQMPDQIRVSMEEILKSSYNSMELISLSRSLISQKIYLSTGLAILLWNRLMGTAPRHYEETASLSKSVHPTKSPTSKNSASYSGLNESPFYTRSMMHPNSCDVMHYWCSDGMRLFRNVRFVRTTSSRFSLPQEYSVDFVVSGNALLQWVMDCTSVVSVQEGLRVARLLLSNGFLTHISDLPIDALATASSDLYKRAQQSTPEFLVASLFRMTPRGSRLCAWENLIDEKRLDIEDIKQDYSNMEAILNGTGDLEKEPRHWKWEYQELPEIDNTIKDLLDLGTIQREPALKVLFKEELTRLHRLENLYFVDESQHALLLIKAAVESQDTVTRRTRLERESHLLLDKLCRRFMTVGSPFELNLSESCRLALVAACGKKDLIGVIEPLNCAKERCAELLCDAIDEFKRGEKIREIPLLRAYIVAKYGRNRLNEKNSNILVPPSLSELETSRV